MKMYYTHTHYRILYSHKQKWNNFSLNKEKMSFAGKWVE